MRVARLLPLLLLSAAAPTARVAGAAAQVPVSGIGPPPAAAARVHASPVPPPGTAESATRLLARHGFVNVAVQVADGRAAACFENARYRDERRALGEAARLLAAELPQARELALVAGSRGIAVVVAYYGVPAGAAARAGAWADAPRVTFDLAGVPPTLLAMPRASVSRGRLELVVHPWAESRFGDYDHPVRWFLGAAPELRVELAHGLSASAQVLVALHDDGLHPGESPVRPALVTLNQTVRLPRNVFLSATAGSFTAGRYGADLEGRVFPGAGRLALGGRVGLTGGARYLRDGWRFGRVRRPLALLDAAIRVPRYDLALQATAGRFLDGDRGARLDASRRFGELEIGFFALRTEAGPNGGVTLRIPLPPATHPAAGAARVRLADTFAWEYRYHGLVRVGRVHDSGDGLDELARRFDPGHLAKPPGAP